VLQGKKFSKSVVYFSINMAYGELGFTVDRV